MIEEKVYLTPEGYTRMERELRELVEVRRPQIATMIRESKEDGDVMENAAYDEAKEQQAFVEGRILHLEDMLKRAQVIPTTNGHETVTLGSMVTVREAEAEAESFRIVGSAEANPLEGRISNESPLGRALMGKRVGDVASYATPDGDTLSFQVIAVD